MRQLPLLGNSCSNWYSNPFLIDAQKLSFLAPQILAFTLSFNVQGPLPHSLSIPSA